MDEPTYRSADFNELFNIDWDKHYLNALTMIFRHGSQELKDTVLKAYLQVVLAGLTKTQEFNATKD